MVNQDGYLGESLSKVERKVILDALRGHNWSKVKTAKSLGISRSTLYRKLKRYKIRSNYEEELDGIIRGN